MTTFARRVALLSTLLVLLALSFTPVCAPASRTAQGNAGLPLGFSTAFGLNQNWSPTHFPDAPARAAALGANSARVSLAWWAVESSRGSYDWTYYDSVYQRLQAKGMRVLWIVTGAPCWAHPSTSCKAWEVWPPEAAYDGDWKRFLTALTARYPNSIGIEVWNEANLDADGWHAIAPARYVQLLAAAFKAIRAANPAMPVVTTSLVRFSGAGNPSGVDWQTWLKDAYAANRRVMVQNSDAIAVHPYPWNSPAAPDMLSIITASRQILKDNGDAGKPIWITETGEADQGFPGASRELQASDLTAMIDTWRQRQATVGDVPVFIVHSLYDDSVSLPGYGLLASDGTVKPAYCAVASAMSRTVAGCPLP